MSDAPTPARKGSFEFITLMAFMMSLVALAIDAILPAFHAVAQSFYIVDENRLQWLIGAVFIGLAAGQLLYGPLSDSVGRKPAIYLGLGLFLIGSLISAFAQSYEMMLWGRFLQGIGVAGPRTVTVAIVRDQFKGRDMARIMSFVMSVFILFPAIAPSLGALILWVADWVWIYYSFVAISITALFWFGLRQAETHPVENRKPFSFKRMGASVGEVLRHRQSVGYMILAGFGFGCLVAYLTTSKLLFWDIFGVDELFPLYFAILALAIGAASVVNGKLVMKHGMRAMTRGALIMMMGSTSLFLAYLWLNDGQASLMLFMVAMIVTFFAMGIVFGNANAMAMEPMGHIAGLASSIIGAGTTFISLSAGSFVGQQYDQTLMPVITGFVGLSVGAYMVMWWAERKTTSGA